MGCLGQKVKGLVFLETENLIGFENNQVYGFLVIIFGNHFGLEVFWQSIDGFLRLWKKKIQKPINFLFLLLNLTFKNRFDGFLRLLCLHN